MSTSDETRVLLDVLAKVLLRCFVFGVLFLLLWVAGYLLAGGFISRQGNLLFGLTPHEINVIHYCGLALVKSCVVLFFLFPYLAIRLVLRKSPR